VNNRINSIAIVHKTLYLGKNHSEINLKYYVSNLFESLCNSISPDNKVQFNATIEDLNIDIDYAVNIGIILNELLTNSFKHGLQKADKKEIRIDITKNKQDNIKVTLFDNGHGIEKINQTKNGFGIEIVRSLVGQLNGDIQFYEKNGNFVEFEVKVF
jgi:two-component sensor histidine kinase